LYSFFHFFKDDPESNGKESPDDDVDLSSPESSPSRLSAVPFHPLYRVTVPDAVKNGDVLQFTIKVYKVSSEEVYLSSTYELRHDKTDIMGLRPAWIQTSLHIRAV
jgi:hypothetical protein